MEERIYLDHAATSPCHPEVVEAMLPYFGQAFGNAAGLYAEARAARRALEGARQQVAAILHCQPREIIFTSGGTESDNLALAGVVGAAQRQGRGTHLVVSAVEHHAVLHTAADLAAAGHAVSHVPPDAQGRIQAAAVGAALAPETCLVSVMLANNEVGTVNPLAEIAVVVHAAGALLHTDAVQAAGLLALDVRQLGCDLLSLSGHKFGGPKGVGVLFVAAHVPLLPRLHGGTQESRRRAGTENVAGAVGLATALRLAERGRHEECARLAALRNELEGRLMAAVPGLVVNGQNAERLPGHLHLTIPGLEGEALVLHLDAAGVAASTGSACTSGSVEASHVLLAMGHSPAVARSSLRLTLGRLTTADHVARVGTLLPALVARLRALEGVA